MKGKIQYDVIIYPKNNILKWWINCKYIKFKFDYDLEKCKMKGKNTDFDIVKIFFIILIFLLPFLLIFLDYFVFFWGNYLMDMSLALFFIGFGIYTLYNIVKKIKQRKIRSRIIFLDNESIYKTILKSILPNLIGGFLFFAFSIIIIKIYIFDMTLDLPTVINNKFVIITCVVESSTVANDKFDHHSQELMVRNLQDNSIMKIDFRFKYQRILENKKYIILYLPNSHLGKKVIAVNT